jgi:hypothetical protein
MNGKREKFTSTWNPENQPSIGHAKRFYRKKFAPPKNSDELQQILLDYIQKSAIFLVI